MTNMMLVLLEHPVSELRLSHEHYLSQDKSWFFFEAQDRTLRVCVLSKTELMLILGRFFCQACALHTVLSCRYLLVLFFCSDLRLLKYQLDTCKEEIKRYKQKSKFKPVRQLSLASGVDIASEWFPFPFVFCATWNICLEILGLSMSYSIVKILKPICLCQNQVEILRMEANCWSCVHAVHRE